MPDEDAEEGMCGELERAAQNWEWEYTTTLQELGFKRGRANPCSFWNQARDLRVVVHGDDFTILGKESELDWLKEELDKDIRLSAEADLAAIRRMTKLYASGIELSSGVKVVHGLRRIRDMQRSSSRT